MSPLGKLEHYVVARPVPIKHRDGKTITKDWESLKAAAQMQKFLHVYYGVEDHNVQHTAQKGNYLGRALLYADEGAREIRADIDIEQVPDGITLEDVLRLQYSPFYKGTERHISDNAYVVENLLFDHLLATESPMDAGTGKRYGESMFWEPAPDGTEFIRVPRGESAETDRMPDEPKSPPKVSSPTQPAPSQSPPQAPAVATPPVDDHRDTLKLFRDDLIEAGQSPDLVNTLTAKQLGILIKQEREKRSATPPAPQGEVGPRGAPAKPLTPEGPVMPDGYTIEKNDAKGIRIVNRKWDEGPRKKYTDVWGEYPHGIDVKTSMAAPPPEE